MAIDPTVLTQLDTAAGRGIAASHAFWEQHAMMIGAQASEDGRRLGGFLSQQLFNQGVIDSKAAYNTPTPPSAAPLPTPPAK